jgi:hypothetical protein
MLRLPLLLSLGALLNVAIAQNTVVVPNGLAATEGNSSTAYPWSRTASVIHVQYCYDSSHFLAQGVSYPIQITQLRWRANSATTAYTGGAYANCRIDMSTAAVDQAVLSTTFASNHGADRSNVYTGSVTVAPTTSVAAGTPNAWYVTVTTTPFVYDPNSGDLLVDIVFPAASWTGGTACAVDCQTTGSLCSRMYNLTSDTAATGTFQANVGPTLEVTYGPVTGGTVARAVPYGTGCYSFSNSFYETFATSAAFDLANTSFSLLPVGGGYQVLPGLTQFVQPSATAQVLALTDDSETVVSLTTPFPHSTGVTSSLAVCSNGYVSVASGNGTGYTPTPATTLNAPNTGWWAQHDYNPAAVGSGSVKFEQVGSIAYVTWDGVYNFGGTTVADANTFQFQFDTSTGVVHVVFGAMSTLGNGRLVAFSPGGPSTDQGGIDISARLPLGISLVANDVLPVGLATSARPLIGTTIQFTTSNVMAGTLLGATMLSFTQINPGIDLGFLGAPGCSQYVTADFTQIFFAAGSSGSTALAIPNFSSYLGLRLLAQSAAFTSGYNSLGIWTSNGIDLTIGNL